MSDINLKPDIENKLQNTTVTTVNVVTVRSKSYAVGLRWELVDDLSQVQAIAKQRAAETKSDLWCLTIEGDPQVGFGAISRGHKSGMSSLAAELAAALPGNWVGLFKITDYYYVLHVVNGLIDSATDLAISDFNQAKILFADMASGDGTDRYISSDLLSSDIDVPGLKVINFEESVGISSVKLRVVSSSVLIRKFFLFFVLIISVLLAIYFLSNFMKPMMIWMGLSQPPKKQVVIIPPQPWTGQIKPIVLLQRCVSTFKSVPLDYAGWKADALICDGKSVRAVLVRQGKIDDFAPPLSYLDSWVKNQKPVTTSDGFVVGLAKLEDTDKTVGLVWTLPKVELQDRWRELDAASDRIQIASRLMRIEIEKRFMTGTFASVLESTYNSRLDFTLDMNSFHLQSVQDFLQRKSTIISSMTMDPKNSLMNVNFRLYSAKPLPKNSESVEVTRSPLPSVFETGSIPVLPK